MLNLANEAHFTLDLSGLKHDFRVLSFRAHEAISQCYRIELQLVSDLPVFPRLAPTGFDQGNGMVADEPVIKRFGVQYMKNRPERPAYGSSTAITTHTYMCLQSRTTTEIPAR
ncbi:hypothetical protein VF673_05610 [Halopseudomonas sp. Lyrl_26]|uniref:hypothetical protein n=1 Tax=Halopseudomonas sp. Lyrl_26 TaxID=3110923 RepID=UPI003F7D8FB9